MNHPINSIFNLAKWNFNEIFNKEKIGFNIKWILDLWLDHYYKLLLRKSQLQSKFCKIKSDYQFD